ncbi:unnamed protein product [Gongylonema pulchrum]|uniref:Suppressor protein SRP40-like n=1 Tax=Gongylonema pulchrum TaxID=637853 RepID=A0A183DBN1_9BILA|nr:unnamed protein product [Gongylonema pulchrum]
MAEPGDAVRVDDVENSSDEEEEDEDEEESSTTSEDEASAAASSSSSGSSSSGSSSSGSSSSSSKVESEDEQSDYNVWDSPDDGAQTEEAIVRHFLLVYSANSSNGALDFCLTDVFSWIFLCVFAYMKIAKTHIGKRLSVCVCVFALFVTHFQFENQKI